MWFDPFSRGSGPQTRGAFEKHGGSISLTVPGEGLFDVLIYDGLKTPRIDLWLAALRSPGGVQDGQIFRGCWGDSQKLERRLPRLASP